MVKNGDARGKVVRRLGINVFGNPKYDRLLERKPHAPGKAPKARSRRVSEYGLQLLEKQRYRAAYGLNERQFRNACMAASRTSGQTGTALLEQLEGRLDNVVFRLGWAQSRAAARQLVSHGFVRVNGARLDRPSAQLRSGDAVELAAPQALEQRCTEVQEKSARLPSWLVRAPGEGCLAGRLVGQPTASETLVPGDIRRVVEFYAR